MADVTSFIVDGSPYESTHYLRKISSFGSSIWSYSNSGERICCVSADSDENAYISCQYYPSGSLRKISSSGSLLWVVSFTYQFPQQCVAVGNFVYLYLQGYNGEGCRLKKINGSDGAVIFDILLAGGGNNGQEVAVDAAGNSYIHFYVGGYQYVIQSRDPDGVFRWNLPFGFDNVPGRIAVDIVGNFYIVGDAGAYKYDSSQNFVWRIAITNMRSVAVDNDLNVYIGWRNQAGKSVTKYDATGVEVWAYDAGAGTEEAQWVAVDPEGNVFVALADYGTGSYTLRKLNSSGALVWSYNSGKDGIWCDQGRGIYANFSPVPVEPRLWHPLVHRSLPPHPSILSGNVSRLPRWVSDYVEPDQEGSPIACRELRLSRPIPPHPSQLLGKFLRLPKRFHFTPPDEPGSPTACRGVRGSREPLGPPRYFLRGRTHRRDGLRLLHVIGVEFYQIYEQGYRVADTSKAVYELFVGVGVPPNLSGSPVATSPTLPFSWTPPAGPVTLHVVVRRRNQYNLESFNVYETLVAISAGGDEDPGSVSPPFDVRIYDGTTPYYTRVIAKYVDTEDRNPADTWEVYATVGADPNSGMDAPVYSAAMTWIGHESGLNAEIGPYADGNVVHVIVCVRRGSGGPHTCAGAVLFTVRVYNLTDGQVFGGHTYENQ